MPFNWAHIMHAGCEEVEETQLIIGIMRAKKFCPFCKQQKSTIFLPLTEKCLFLWLNCFSSLRFSLIAQNVCVYTWRK